MITSAQNRQIKEIQALNARHKERARTGLFTAEGVKLFTETPRNLLERVFVSASFVAANPALLREVPYETVEDTLFSRICDTKTPQGILSVVRQPAYQREDLLGNGAPFLLVLEDLQDPGNVGTILRTAEGAGVTGILLTGGCADLFAPKTIRSTMGSVFRVPFLYEDDPADTMDWLAENRIKTYAAHLSGSCSYRAPSYLDGCAFLIGNEGNGLSDYLTQRCDVRIRIPMEGKLESLNAAVASAILMYTVHEKRTKERI